MKSKTCIYPNCKNPIWSKKYCKCHQHHRPDKVNAPAETRRTPLKRSPIKRTFQLEPIKPKKRKPIRKISKTLTKKLEIYRKLRIEFLSQPENQICPVFPHLPATEIHHKKGRGRYLNDIRTWLAVSREGHEWIENNPEEAKKRGWSISRLTEETNILFTYSELIFLCEPHILEEAG